MSTIDHPRGGDVGPGVLYEGGMVPASLRTWFVIHFIADVLVAVPLFLAPTTVLGWLGWTAVDPVATRGVAAALFGIGIESYLGRKSSAEALHGMLRLKVIWSATAALGTLWSLLDGAPRAAWAILAIFAAFHGVWVRYLLLLRRARAVNVRP